MCVHAYLRLYNGCLLSKQHVSGMLTVCQQILRQIDINCIRIKLVICPVELLLSDSRLLAEKVKFIIS
ncbi:hypothetical protein ALC60_11599 [Trachymyrmex zeteki]|uniref:Uncharacterized protein n=1 Tax=Mycetomoellerius zeteki TaxID=64791 RepID=A0A151WND0_9HYME|nr:hypothetical protein ALC60_11599 [Trachymyrmex zeteki]